jgi:hypothetical protein
MRPPLLLALLLAALQPQPASPYRFTEELSVTPLEAAAPWASTLHPEHALVSFTLSHHACAGEDAADYFPAAWRDLLLGSGDGSGGSGSSGEGAVLALSASLAAGRVPSGWRLPAWAARSSSSGSSANGSAGSGLPTDAAPGARLLLTLGAPGAAAAAAPGAQEWAQWDRAARLASRAAHASLTGTATAPRALPLGGAASAQGLVRDWYAHALPPPTLGGAPAPRVVELAVPRAALCVEALWGVAAASPCRGHAGLGAALAPSAIVSAPWHALTWEASAEAAAQGSGSGSGNRSSSARACRALRLTAAVHAVLPTGSGGGSSLPALRQLLQVPEAWGAGMPAACPLAARSALRLHAANGSAAVLPLQALAAAGAAAEAAAAAAASAAPPPPPPPAAHLLRACLFTTRAVSPPYPALGLLSVTTSVRNGCSAAAWREALAAAAGQQQQQQQQWEHALVLSAALPWMLAPVEGSEVAWVEEALDTRGSAAAGARAAAAAAAVAGQWGQQQQQQQQQQRGPALLRSTLPLPLPPPGGCLHHALQLRCCGGSPGQREGLMHSEEGPPDAARGIEVPPARLRLVRLRSGARAEAEAAGAEWMAEGGTVEVPAVDASMPYNVVVLVSTVAAFACGAVINAVARSKV